MPHDLKTQLSNYGSWLEQRSDVALRAPDIAIVPDASGQPPVNRPDRAEWPLTRVLVAAGVLAIALVSGAILALPGGEGDDEVVAGSTIDPSDDDSPVRDDVDDDRSEGEETDPSPQPTRRPTTTVETRPTGGRPTDSRPTDSRPTDSQPITTATTTTTTTTVTRPVVGDRLFITPGAGAKISLDANVVFEVAAIDGAARYSFAGWQNGQQILHVSGANNALVLPSRFATSDGGWPPSAGRFTMTVVVTDRAGVVLADGEVTVVIATTDIRPTLTLPDPTTKPTGSQPTIDIPVPTVPNRGESTLVTIPKGPNV